MDDDDLLLFAVVGVVGVGAFLYFTGRIGSPYAARQGGLFGPGGGSSPYPTLDYVQVAPGVYQPVNASGQAAGPETSAVPAGARIVQAASGAGLAIGTAAAAPGALSAAAIAIPIVGAAAGLLTWGIMDQGWFRGGEVGISVNPRRDKFLLQFGPGGFEANSGITVMHHQLNQWLGEANGEAATQALLGAESDEELTAVEKQIAAVYAQHGVRIALF